MLDAPVSGGVVGATAGTLSLMVGGSEASYDGARPLIDTMGKSVYCGESGRGLGVKIVNKYVPLPHLQPIDHYR